MTRAGRRRPAAGVRPLVAVARPWLAGAVTVGLAQAVLLVAQAAVLARLLSAGFYGGVAGRLTGGLAARAGLLIALLAVAQALCGWAWEACTEAAARRARAATRRQGLARVIGLAASGRLGADAAGAAGAGGAGTAGPGGAGTAGAGGAAGLTGGEPGPGGLAALLGAGVDELDAFTGRVLPRTVLALAVPALLLAWIAHLDLVSAGLAAVALTVAPVLAGLIGADTAAAVRRRLASLEQLSDRFTALVEGLPVLRAFGRAGDHERAVAASGEDVRAATLATLRLALLAGLVLELLAAVGTALVALRLGVRLDDGQRILPQALAVLILTPEVFLPVRRLTADFHAGASGRAALARLGRLTAADRIPGGAAESAAEADGRAGRTGARTAGAVRSGPDQPDPGPLGVLLHEACLIAAGRGEPVLDRISLRIEPGERVCLTGESGAGKSSLLRVIAGLVPPTAGEARLVGHAPGGGDPEPGRRPPLGWVPQHPTVLAATVLDNVAVGRPGVDEHAAAAALAAAQLGPWLRSLPRGLRTPLSGLDAPLSLGERRRLAVARSLAGPRPRLWLLDEPTAGLDRGSAERLVARLSRLLGGATAVIASHDPAALALGQRTVELHRGRVLGPADGPAAGRPGARQATAEAVTAR